MFVLLLVENEVSASLWRSKNAASTSDYFLFYRNQFSAYIDDSDDLTSFL